MAGSSSPALPFKLPPPPGFTEPPVWTGEAFRSGQNVARILSYETGRSGWTDELTIFHEVTAGHDHYIDRASRRHTMRSLRRWLKTEAPVIVDIGCSSGLMLNPLQEKFPRGIILGADYVYGPIESLAKKLPGVPLLQFDLTACPLPDQSVDAVVLLNVLEHIEDDELAIAHVARILKPGGVAVIEVPAGPGLYDIYDKTLLHQRRYRMRDLLAKITRAKFRVLEKSHLGFFVYPAFWLVKKRQRRFLSQSPEIQQQIVSRNISLGASSSSMHRLMQFEGLVRKCIYYPFGIRCLVTCGIDS